MFLVEQDEEPENPKARDVIALDSCEVSGNAQRYKCK